MAMDQERLFELKAWATNRIRTCREQERKFGEHSITATRGGRAIPQALVEAWTERRALQAVFEILGWEEPKHDHPTRAETEEET
jgi:hypothetical protein